MCVLTCEYHGVVLVLYGLNRFILEELSRNFHSKELKFFVISLTNFFARTALKILFKRISSKFSPKNFQIGSLKTDRDQKSWFLEKSVFIFGALIMRSFFSWTLQARRRPPWATPWTPRRRWGWARSTTRPRPRCRPRRPRAASWPTCRRACSPSWPARRSILLIKGDYRTSSNLFIVTTISRCFSLGYSRTWWVTWVTQKAFIHQLRGVYLSEGAYVLDYNICPRIGRTRLLGRQQ